MSRQHNDNTFESIVTSNGYELKKPSTNAFVDSAKRFVSISVACIGIFAVAVVVDAIVSPEYSEGTLQLHNPEPIQSGVGDTLPASQPSASIQPWSANK